MFIWASIAHNEALHSLGFTPTQGQVVVSRTRIGTSRGTRVTDSQVKYRYTVASKEYESEVVRFKAGFTQEEDVRKFPLGSQVQVYFDPKNPNKACLEPGEVSGVSNVNSWTASVGVIWSGLGLVLLTFGYVWKLCVRWAELGPSLRSNLGQVISIKEACLVAFLVVLPVGVVLGSYAFPDSFAALFGQSPAREGK